MSRWSAYYDRHAQREPREQLALVVEAVEDIGDAPRQAADLGFGQGTETIALLERGWRVFAVDAEPEAEQRLRTRLTPDLDDRLTVTIAPFAEVELPPCDLIWSGLALPFCAPDAFDEVWRRARGALRPGGVLGVDLFGPRHAWAGRTTTFSRGDIDHLLAGLDVLTLDEQDHPRPTVNEGTVQWHAFFLVARQPVAHVDRERFVDR